MNEKVPDRSDERMQESWRIADLLDKYLRYKLTPEEQAELEQWKSRSEGNSKLFNDLTNQDNIDKAMQWFRKLEKEKALQKLKSGIAFNKSPKIFTVRKFLIAASVIGIVAITALVIYKRNTVKALSERSRAVKAPDVAPGGNKATITFSDGSTIALNDRASGILKNENGATVNKTESGQVTYYPTNVAAPAAVFNILETPRGGQYAIVLPDGSKAWLNASSRLKYPVVFTGDERRVEATGEIYFEVKKGLPPFVVQSGVNSIRVLGTHFNLSHYAGEVFTTTLLEGSIRIRSGADSMLMTPGQQAKVDQKIILTNPDHPKDAVAWKNGFFQFSKMSIKDIMKQLARWYDIEVIYKKDFIDASFTATVSRNENISIILKRLEKAGGVSFTIEGRRVTVQPQM